MPPTRKVYRAERLDDLAEAATDTARIALHPTVLTHIYIHLDMKDQYKFATTKDDALSYLKAVAKTALISATIAKSFGGRVLEVQGSTIHVGLPEARSSPWESFTAAVHTSLLQGVEPTYRAVTGWRMTADTGQTLVVPGRGVHGDLSFVSLGNAANWPAKHLYSQLERYAEEDRHLKKYHVGVRDRQRNRWMHFPLSPTTSDRDRRFSVAASVSEDFSVRLGSSHSRAGLLTAMAEPLGDPGTDGSPTADSPGVYFGWVLRADLDGFTRRVESCFNQDEALLNLGKKFVEIMEAAERFTADHSQRMLQLPWAGDNYTAAAVFSTKRAYEDGRHRRLVDHALDFDGHMEEVLDGAGFGGWAFGIGGADVNGKAAGNVFIGSVEFDGFRFLVGAGQGFSRSLQAFADIKPDAERIALYVQDYHSLDRAYKDHFGDAITVDDRTSTIFKLTKHDGLKITRLEAEAGDRCITASVAGGGAAVVPAKPFGQHEPYEQRKGILPPH